jgi:hypothetical protein
MKHWLGVFLTASTMLAASLAHAAFHLFTIEQIYSNADGTVQFVTLTTNTNGENFWSLGAQMTSVATGGPTKVQNFMSNLPSSNTAGKHVLVATQGFADLGLITPDFIIPNNFIPTGPGSLTYVSSRLQWESLPTDGMNSLYVTGVAPNMATNFAGQSASISAPPPPAALNFQGIWWAAPAASESGWGLNVAHQGDTIFASWFTYDPTGKGWWAVMTANKIGTNMYQGQLFETTGPAFDAVPFNPANVVATPIGTGTLTFSDANNGTFHYTVNKGGNVDQTKTLVRQVFGPLPTCVWGAQPNLTLATNYQDLWWKSPAASESGWGINLNQEGNTIFATWFTYNHDGTPLWLVVTANATGPGVFTGDLFQTTGPPFSSMPFNPGMVIPTKVGTATFTFADGNDASFNYTVQLSDMMVPVTQTKAITREVFAAPGTVCSM